LYSAATLSQLREDRNQPRSSETPLDLSSELYGTTSEKTVLITGL
jgi:hypothetical protein